MNFVFYDNLPITIKIPRTIHAFTKLSSTSLVAMALSTQASARLRAHRSITGNIRQTVLLDPWRSAIHLQLLVRRRIAHVALARLATPARLTEAHAARVIAGRGAQPTAQLLLLLLQTPAQLTDLQLNVKTLGQARLFDAKVLALKESENPLISFLYQIPIADPI